MDALNVFRCPSCKQELIIIEKGLSCVNCKQHFRIKDNIPDFLNLNESDGSNPFLHGFGRLLAPIYETPFWYNLMMKLLGGRHAPTLKEITRTVEEKMAGTRGYILDIATGTATFGRHIANKSRVVYGVDISFEMLEKGSRYIKKEKKQNIQLARCDAMNLPFGYNFFDGCLFMGSLHIFDDTEKVIRGVGDTLKPGALMIVTTLIKGDRGLLKNGRSRPHQKLFEISELQTITKKAGFEDFQYQAFGCLIMLTVRKQNLAALN